MPMPQLTPHEIREIVGRLSDDRVAAILATGATAGDVLDAFTWLTSGEYRGGKLVKPQSGRVAEVYEILKPDEPDIEEERPR
jgi:hypothetical protein